MPQKIVENRVATVEGYTTPVRVPRDRTKRALGAVTVTLQGFPSGKGLALLGAYRRAQVVFTKASGEEKAVQEKHKGREWTPAAAHELSLADTRTLESTDLLHLCLRQIVQLGVVGHVGADFPDEQGRPAPFFSESWVYLGKAFPGAAPQTVDVYAKDFSTLTEIAEAVLAYQTGEVPTPEELWDAAEKAAAEAQAKKEAEAKAKSEAEKGAPAPPSQEPTPRPLA